MSTRPDPALFAALHGPLTPRANAADAYSLFVARSSAMGWLTEPREGALGGCWGMNDAGFDADGAWFQVTATAEMVPLQAFLVCAGDVVARLGDFRLESVELTVPVRTEDVAELMQDAGWFADQHSPVPVMVTPQPPEVIGWLRDFRQDVVTFSSASEAVLAEWSPAAVGWLAAFLSAGHAQHGNVLRLRVSRVGP